MVRSASRVDVVMLTTVHPATDDRIFYREARALAQAGLKVAVVGPHERSEVLEDVLIEALPRARNRFCRLLMGWTALRMGVRLGGRLFIFHDPELFGVAVILRLLGKSAVYDCHENVPTQILQKIWIPKVLRRAVASLALCVEWTLSRCMTAVFLARDTLQRRFPKRRTVRVRNFATREVLEVAGDALPIAERKNIVIYAGGLSALRGIRELVRAFKKVNVPDAELWLAGPFETDEFRAEILAALPPNANWLGWLEHPQVLRLYRSAKLGVNLLYPTPSHRNSQPIKLYEYLGAGLPVVASNFPEFREVLDGCGVLVDPADTDAVAAAISDLLTDGPRLTRMAAVGRTRVLSQYSWEAEAERMVTFCRQTLST